MSDNDLEFRSPLLEQAGELENARKAGRVKSPFTQKAEQGRGWHRLPFNVRGDGSQGLPDKVVHTPESDTLRNGGR